jgi:hypothetical protein
MAFVQGLNLDEVGFVCAFNFAHSRRSFFFVFGRFRNDDVEGAAQGGAGRRSKKGNNRIPRD